MRIATINATAVEEIGYFDNERLRCTSWGMAEIVVPLRAPQFTIGDRFGGTLNIRPLGGSAHEMIGLRLGHHHAITDPKRLVDIVIVDEDVGVAITHTNGAILSIGGNHEDDMRIAVEHALRDTVDDAHRRSIVSDGDIAAIAIATSMGIGATVYDQRLVILPFSFILSALAIFGIVSISRKQMSLANELASMIKRRKLGVHYQPIIDIKTGECIGAEALVRWRMSDGNFMRPDVFVQVAEETGQMAALTDLVIETAVEELGPAMRQDRSVHVAINLGAEDVGSGRFLCVLEKVLAKHGVLHEQIWLEATERGFPEMTAARNTVAKARALGYKVAIDDFGTGYSSLSYIESIQLDALKIDKAFIDSIGRGLATSSVTPYIIDMAKALDLVIVAEGIETQAQVDFLNDHGVELGQGWFFAKAMPAQDFIAYFKKSKEKKRQITPVGHKMHVV